MLRRLVFAVFLAALLFGMAFPVFAQVSAGSPASDDPWAPQDKGSVFEKIFAGLVGFPVRVVANLAQQGGFQTLDKLVFGQGLSEAEKRARPWDPAEFDVVRLWFKALSTVTVPFYTVVVSVTGFRLLYGSLNPAARAEAIESVQRWFLSVGIVVLAPLLVDSLMWLAGIMTEAIGGAFDSVAVELGRSVQDWASVSPTGEGITTGSVLGTTVVRVFLTFMFFYLNIIYIIRKYVITVMFAFTPMMALLWAINRQSLAAAVWLGELASNAFMSTAHALALTTLMLICDVKNSGTWLTFTVMIHGVVPVAEALRNSLQSLLVRWAGIREESIARSALFGVLGLGGFLSLVRLGAATFGSGGRSVPKGVRVLPGSSSPVGTVALPGGPYSRGGGFTGPAGPSGERPKRRIGFRMGGDEVEKPAGGAGGASSGGPRSFDGGSVSGGYSVARGDVPGGAAGPGPGYGTAGLSGQPWEAAVPGGSGPEGMFVPGRYPPGITYPAGAPGAPALHVGYASVASGGVSGLAQAGGLQPALEQPWVSPKLQKALRFGAKAGKVAMAAAALTYFAVGGAVPGGQAFAGAATLAVGYLGRLAGTASYLGGSYIEDKAKKAAEKIMQRPGVQAVTGRVRQVGQRVMGVPAVQKAASVARRTGSAVKTAYNFVRQVTYPDHRRGGLDSWRYF